MLRNGLSAGIVPVLLAITSVAGVIYVDDDAPPGGNGQSWISAYAFLQDALTTAQTGDEIRVAGGVHYPDRDAVHPIGTADRDASFNLVSGAAVYGGYAGLSLPSDPDHRDSELYRSILNGNIGSPTDAWDNTKHVVTAANCVDTVLDGIAITDGHGTFETYYSQQEYGLGMKVSNSTIVLRGCSITNNIGGEAFWTMGPALTFGAGVYANQSELTFVECLISRNIAGRGGSNSFSLSLDFGGVGGDGGGIFASNGSLVRLIASVIADNAGGPGGVGTHAQIGGHGGRGGALFVGTSSRAELVDCLVCGNRGGYGGNGSLVGGPGGPGGEGGGLFIDDSSILSAIGCLFSNNHAGDGGSGAGHGGNGGGIYSASSAVRLTACTVVDNTAGLGGSGYGGGAPGDGGALYCDNNAAPEVSNSILRLATPEAIFGQPTVTFSDVQGGWPGTGNISADPRFVDPNGPDNDPNTWADNDYRLSPGSPCIDAGDNLNPPRDVFDLDGDGCVTEPLPVDLDGYVRYVDDPNTPDTGLGAAPFVDMGAYEFGATQPPVGGPCTADLNCDGVINFDDIDPYVLALSDPAAYQALFPNCFISAADCNNDGVVNFDDINPFVALLSG